MGMPRRSSPKEDLSEEAATLREQFDEIDPLAGMPLSASYDSLVVPRNSEFEKALACIREYLSKCEKKRNIQGNAESLEAEPEHDAPSVINRWETRPKGRTGDYGQVEVIRLPNGKSVFRIVLISALAERLLMSFHSFSNREYQRLRAENRALRVLRRLVGKRRYELYRLTDKIVEFGRSGVVYIIRKNLPTLALRNGPHPRLLAALCLHPLGYYEGSFAGALVPTDDVVAHLIMIRTDEHAFWKKANQHQPPDPRAGI